MSQRAPEALNSPIRVQRSRATPRNVACVTQGLSRAALGGVMHRSFLLLAIAATPVALPSPTAAQQDADTGYAKTQAMVPMRDGVKLRVVILAPRAATPLPILLQRTPYNADGATGLARRAKALGLDGYIIVFGDIRGRFRSEGRFDMNRPPRGGSQGIDESTDAYDTIDWLVKHVPNNNGRVGTFGVSYPGWLTAVTGMGPHPALKAISPQAPMGDTWMGDDFFHQGAFRLSYGTEYTWSMESSSDQSEDPSPSRYDLYEWYRSFPTLAALARTARADRWPSWHRFSEHPAYDSVWQARALPRYMGHATVPTLVVGGWWDQEDEYGPLAHYAALERTDTARLVHLVMGPWYHGQWSGDSGTALGNVRFGRATGVEYRELQSRWFAYWLKGDGDGRFPEAWLFDAGTDSWRTFDKWPPATTGSEADWVAKLIDVYPDTVPGRPEMQGYELMVTGDIMRGRYRKSWERPEAIPPNTIQPFTVDLHQQAYTFQKGHRIMVQVESSWFPLYDRNPQTFMPNIFQAHAGDYKAPVHRVYRTAQYPSNMEIDVLTSP